MIKKLISLTLFLDGWTHSSTLTTPLLAMPHSTTASLHSTSPLWGPSSSLLCFALHWPPRSPISIFLLVLLMILDHGVSSDAFLLLSHPLSLARISPNLHASKSHLFIPVCVCLYLSSRRLFARLWWFLNKLFLHTYFVDMNYFKWYYDFLALY